MHQPNATDDEVVGRIIGACHGGLVEFARLDVAAPLDRAVHARSDRWLWWLAPGGPKGRQRLVVPEPAGTVATSMIDELIVEPVEGRDLCIDRSKLVELSGAAAHGGHLERVRLFVAGQVWGSGTTNGRGPWRTTQALADPRVETHLCDSAAAARVWKPSEARRAWAVSGIGTSFATKWLWAATLDVNPPAGGCRPLILDDRVRGTLGLLGWRPGHAADPDGSYAAWVSAAHRWAQVLRERGLAGADAEKVEWLLFDRERGRGNADIASLHTRLEG